MKKTTGRDGTSRDALRERAETSIRQGEAPRRDDALLMTALHELQVHQVELELQNETYRQTVAALQEAHDRYLDLYQLSPIGYVTADENQTILETNITAAHLLGAELEGLIDRRFDTLVAAEDQARWRRFFADQIAQGGRHHGQFKLASQDGAPRSVRLDCLGVRRESLGVAVHIALTDESEMLAKENALGLSEARYRAIFDHARNGMVIADARSRRFIDANEAFLKMTGIRRDQLGERGVADIHPAAALPRALAAFDRLAAGEVALIENLPVAPVGGGLLHVDINGGPFEQDGVRYVLGEFHDTSARLRVEDALREQEAFFRLIAENISGFVAVLDGTGRLLYRSPSYKALQGDSPCQSDSFFADIHPEDRPRVIDAFSKAVVNGSGPRLEYRYVCADGRIRLLESRGGVIHDEAGKTRRVVVVSNDITERKAADEIIHRLAYFDALTHLPNRQTLSDRLQQAIAASKRNGQYGALMFLDLDHFKNLNDSHGHGAGDQLLTQAAGRLRECVREIDTVARFGGDEFVVLLTELGTDAPASAAATLLVAEKIREAIARPFTIHRKSGKRRAATFEHHCTASIGVKLFLKATISEEDLLKFADMAMYRAKEAGRNCIRFHEANEA